VIIIPKEVQVRSSLHVPDGHTCTANDILLAKRASELLNRHYPLHLWGVFVNSEAQGGVLQIKNFSVSYRYGYTLHLTTLTDQKIIQAGGEILERAAMKRGSWNGQQAEFIEGVPLKHQPIKSLGIIV